MEQNREKLEPAFLISSTPFKETSLIGFFFTFEYGLISLVVRGVRKPKSKIFLQPFTPLLLNFFGKGELKTCGKLEVASNPIWLKGNALASGWYMNELIQKLLPQGVALKNLFTVYGFSLANLAEKTKLLVALREFELQLLTSIGVNPHFKTNDDNDFILDKKYTFIANEGFFLEKTREDSNLTFSGKDLISIKNKTWDNSSLKACKKLNTFFIGKLLGNRKLESRNLLIRR